MLGETTRCANSTPPLTKPTLSEVNVAVGNLFPDSGNTKRCSCCKSSKPVAEFNKSKTSKDGLAHRCRECGKAQCRAWYLKNIDKERERARNRSRVYGPAARARNKRWAEANPERARYHSRKKLLRKKYGMTIEDHDALFAAQGFVCGACGADSPNSKKGWSTDHCHETGKVRGILCHHCNVGLGHAKDNIKALRAWIAYLEKSASRRKSPPAIPRKISSNVIGPFHIIISFSAKTSESDHHGIMRGRGLSLANPARPTHGASMDRLCR